MGEATVVRRYSAPGNLLLCGEYAIVNPGGTGVAVATAPRLSCTVRPAAQLQLEGRMGERRFRWAPQQRSGLFFCVLDELCTVLNEIYIDKKKWCMERIASLPLEVSVDSSALLRPDGGKAGFGSSAAVTALLLFALTDAVTATPPLPEQLLQPAVRAHRRFQGGRGSGYDVAASLFGGIGLFTGGEHPGWQPVAPAWSGTLWSISGAAPVSSAAGVVSYAGWQHNHPAADRAFCAVSRRSALRLVESRGGAAAFALNRAALPGCWLGRRLGRSPEAGLLGSRIKQLRSLGWGAKASGAGDELGVAFSPEPLYFNGMITVGDDFLRHFNRQYGWQPALLQLSNSGVRRELSS